MFEPADPQRLFAAIDAVAARHFATLADVDVLAHAVRTVSDSYTRRGASLPSLQGDRAALQARLRFFLPRDLPKLLGPLSELRWADALPSAGSPTDPPLRVLDLGAGLGTTALATALCLARGPDARALRITALDSDAAALSILRDVMGACSDMFERPVAVHTEHGDLAAAPRDAGPARYDLIVAGLSLNEVLQDRDDDVDEGLRLLRRWTGWLSADGALVVLEPALRPQSRRLQEMRAALIAAGGAPYPFAPCTHRGPCPLLSRQRDWCHELRPLTLPAPLRAIAAGAGLRDRDLSYAYLTLLARDRQLGDRASAQLLRGVSAALGSKGKTELQLCGPGGLQRLVQLDRTRRDGSFDLAALGRGALLSIAYPEAEVPPAQLRVDKVDEVRVHRTWSTTTTVIHPPVEPRP